MESKVMLLIFVHDRNSVDLPVLADGSENTRRIKGKAAVRTKPGLLRLVTHRETSL
jgi:hypothetical protein